MDNKNNYHMGINLVLKIIDGKWKPSIICALGLKERRYNELLRYECEVNNTEISKKVMSEQLKQLEDDQIVERTSFGTVPPKVVYSLTEYGQELRGMMIEMSKFGEDIAKELQSDDDPITFDYSYREINPDAYAAKQA
ncbi:winged helix-turn-helix transcriptional regulator [Companilactobacillus sp.]|jgi:DNA-binding HxlR family transcriptional regulator|uniref:winged helix-turn-helix transcriptional regulator n=1 Tax=Companilactobacillus sp. TaxID=2767905 RepID=UPI0025C000C2|nr:helix-turn-helix domain-containing protein [Companilactobacillus sp.]MCH4009161.1 helix-turn-helix transcriptional regulator [Companilactobacillus sp.]MCH4050660.1 helix-turn-helix transcriptional regulator [Companilactobacillus sp.]MCH4077103.1 helix-turn-helix transcriptional regulator [Companilactobacillus sp.]MCH4125679.1 helix-turn-helix transcriptional regulator [Companilactobacillus sp.]MCI1311388.1 helix-turn-helix transcriptional regulator [Companilactobacillus sp.]